MLKKLWILVLAAQAGASPRRFLFDDTGETTCVDGVVDKTGLPCTVCDGESAEELRRKVARLKRLLRAAGVALASKAAESG